MTETATLRETITNSLVCLMRPIVGFLEKRGFTDIKLVATCDYEVEWEVESGDLLEMITFYLMEYPSGRRDWRVYEYGKCAEEFIHQAYLKDILIWTYGGPLPREAKKVGATMLEVINLEPIQPPTA
jgi:hypothetical protein